MDESYYSDEMKKFVAAMREHRVHDFDADIYMMEDDEGEFLTIVVNSSFSGEEVSQEKARDIAEWLIHLRDGLKELGARVTFLVESDYE
jgi:hypothetical protein